MAIAVRFPRSSLYLHHFRRGFTFNFTSVNNSQKQFIVTTPRRNIMTNSAAWLTAAKARPFEVKPADTYTPAEHEILVENRAIGINPSDGSLQAFAWLPLKYPTILGQDISGNVVAVGSGVTRFKKGDRIVAHAVGMGSQRIQDNAFQAYTIINEHMASPIPDNLPYENAAVLPLGISTAACALFQEAPFLQLHYPTEPAQKPTGKVVLIWGGSSTVGSNAIQLARAAGYTAVTTASTKNHDYVKNLGASEVFDYNSSTISEDLTKALQGKEIVGVVDCIGGNALKVCVEVLHKVQGKGAIATAKGGVDDPPEGITIKRIFGTTLKDNAVGKAIYVDFLPKALAAGTYIPSPGPRVEGKGLEHLQAAVDRVVKGVSATKVVVTL
ncbi:zinc-binding oxidoreductase CipB [Myriangium duriaei CBS 260.36]|uniref:Zinc-binding oxidoreductase CipB n=1 Tax=Myriangium duriaei CBS 260.36 TaxID=1168546 RepID=A0A9P4MFL7_9PEZI|nr:zinc-binding oxidoreductase CipB [Myriangium duriaei CBS 260.36]